MNFDDNFDDFQHFNNHMNDMEKQMLKIDVSRSGVMPLDYEEFVSIFGEPNDEDLFDLSQSYIRLYMMKGDDEYIFDIVESYGEKWVNAFLEYNIRTEEYELCALFKEHLDVYKNNLKIY